MPGAVSYANMCLCSKASVTLHLRDLWFRELGFLVVPIFALAMAKSTVSKKEKKDKRGKREQEVKKSSKKKDEEKSKSKKKEKSSSSSSSSSSEIDDDWKMQTEMVAGSFGLTPG